MTRNIPLRDMITMLHVHGMRDTSFFSTRHTGMRDCSFPRVILACVTAASHASQWHAWQLHSTRHTGMRDSSIPRVTMACVTAPFHASQWHAWQLLPTRSNGMRHSSFPRVIMACVTAPSVLNSFRNPTKDDERFFPTTLFPGFSGFIDTFSNMASEARTMERQLDQATSIAWTVYELDAFGNRWSTYSAEWWFLFVCLKRTGNSKALLSGGRRIIIIEDQNDNHIDRL